MVTCTGNRFQKIRISNSLALAVGRSRCLVLNSTFKQQHRSSLPFKRLQQICYNPFLGLAGLEAWFTPKQLAALSCYDH